MVESIRRICAKGNIVSLVFITMIVVLCAACTSRPDKDDYYVSLKEDYGSINNEGAPELVVFHDSIAVFNPQNGWLYVYRTLSDDKDGYTFESIAVYNDDLDPVAGEVPPGLTARFDNYKFQWEVGIPGFSLGNVKRVAAWGGSPKNKAFALHTRLRTQSDPDAPAGKHEVPVLPDYSSGSSIGSTNDFTPGNYNEFVQYYLGIILGVMCLAGFVILFFGKGGYSDYRFRQRGYPVFFYVCFFFAVIVTTVEIQAFVHNPHVLFESDFPLFRNFGRVFFFCALSIIMVNISRHLQATIESRNGLDAWSINWLFNICGIGVALYFIYSVYDFIMAKLQTDSISLFIQWPVLTLLTLGLVQLLRVTFSGKRLSWIAVLYYLVIYPWSFVEMVFGGALGLLGKIAREKPESDHGSNVDPDHHYAVDVMGNGVYLTRLSGNQWIDRSGNLFSRNSSGFSRQSDNHLFH